MTNSPEDDDKTEQVLTQVLHDLPLRRAPFGLEARVLQRVQSRRSRGWWRRGFSHWPGAARVGFVSICVALVSATLMDSRWSTLGAQILQRAFRWVLAWTYPAVGAVTAATDLLPRIASALPTNSLFTLAAVGAALYATLFGLGAIAYRTLYLSPSPRQVIR